MSPIFETILGSFEKDLSPIILLEPLILRSNTGTELMFIPNSFNKYDVLSIKILK